MALIMVLRTTCDRLLPVVCLILDPAGLLAPPGFLPLLPFIFIPENLPQEQPYALLVRPMKSVRHDETL